MRRLIQPPAVSQEKRRFATRGIFRLARRAQFVPVAVLAMCFVALAAMPVAHADQNSNGSLTITIPSAENGTAEGPVGANVTVVGAGLTAGDSYKFGYSPSYSTCSAVFDPFNISSQSAAPDGTLRQTIIWPQEADAVGTSYYICVRDVTNNSAPTVQSSQLYKVDTAAAPRINVKVAPQPTPGAGTPTTSPSAPQPSGVFYSGQEVTVTGENFVPGGQDLSIYITRNKVDSVADLQAGAQLSLSSGSGATFSADETGAFSQTVTITQPSSGSLPHEFYLYVVSSDATSTAPPALTAFQKFKMQSPPATPTPTTAIPTATPSTPSTGGTTANNNGGSSGNMTTAIIFGVVSVVLFIAGVALLASAMASPSVPRR
jgi:hypothetical protein